MLQIMTVFNYSDHLPDCLSLDPSSHLSCLHSIPPFFLHNTTILYPPLASTTPQITFNQFPVWHIVLFGILASIISLVTITGNLVVILSFFFERSIRQPSNYFICSLAFSDLLIGS